MLDLCKSQMVQAIVQSFRQLWFMPCRKTRLRSFRQVQGGGHATGLMPGYLGEPFPWLLSYGDGGPIAQAYVAQAVPIPGYGCLAKSREMGVLQGRYLGLCWVHFG